MTASTRQVHGLRRLASWWVLVAIMAAIVITPLALAVYVMCID